MNSAIQCLSHAFELTKYMITDNFEPDLNVRNPLGTGKKRGEWVEIIVVMIWFKIE